MPLTKLGFNDTKVSDLGPLHGMGLDELWLKGTEVADLSALRGMSLKAIELGNSRVGDLEPLRGMPLKNLGAYNAPIADLSPLQGMPLERLHVSGTKVKDLSVLRGMPLTNLRFHGCTELTDVSPLAECKEIREITLPPNPKDVEFFRAFSRLDRIGYAEDSKSHPDKTPAAFWKEYGEQGWLRALRATGTAIKSAKKLPDGTWDVRLDDSPTSDLAPLRGAPISVLLLSRGVPDLAPLQGMAIKKLWLTGTKFTDLSPLKGMPLDFLSLSSNVYVTDLSVLRGMPLVELRLHDCTGITDLSPLKDCKELKWIILPPNAKGFEFLRTFPVLERISFEDDSKNGYRPTKTAAAFWKDYDGQGWLRALRATTVEIKAVRQLPDGTWDLNLDNSKISDLTILQGAAISALSLNTAPVADLTPLRGMALTKLNLSNTQVSDLSPIKGMPITFLVLRNTHVTDLSVLRGMPLTSLFMTNNRELKDLSPLEDCKALTTMTLPPGAKNIEFLRAFPKMERISFGEASNNFTLPKQDAAEFWKEWEAKKK
jgi:Leucine-rich repeat (LRR) protein